MAETIREMIKRHEGFRNKVYVDSVGIPTVGYGHALLPGSRIPKQALDIIFEADFDAAYVGAEELENIHGLNLDEVRFNVLIDMCFNLGPDRLRKFKKMWAALKEGDYEMAALEMLNSKWAKQVGNRSVELAKAMATGRFE